MPRCPRGEATVPMTPVNNPRPMTHADMRAIHQRLLQDPFALCQRARTNETLTS
jgi:hypothetical protein